MNIKDIDTKTLNTIASLSKEDYEKIQKEAVKRKAIGRLNSIAELIEKENYQELKKYIDTSPAGDGHGKENCYITFDNYEDIGDIINYLSDETIFQKW